MLTIGYDAKRLFHNPTGLGNYSRTLVSNMAKLYPTNSYHLYCSKVEQSLWRQSFPDKEFNIHNYKGTNRAYWRSYGVTHELSTSNINIYHGLSNELPLNIKKGKMKSVVTIHDMIYHKRPQDFPWIDRNIYHIKTKKACQQADKVIAISHQTKQDIINILKVNPSKIEVVYQSCQSAFYTPRPVESNKHIREKLSLPKQYILSVGSLQPRKNLDLLIDSYRLLPSDCQVPVVVIGKGKMEGALRSKVDRLGISSQFLWLNNIESTETLQSIYHLATLLVYPSHYEGFGLPVVEASLCGVASITSAVSSLPEAGGPDVTLINPNDKNELASNIENLLKNDSLREKKAISSQKYAFKNFSPSKTTADLLNLYQSIL